MPYKTFGYADSSLKRLEEVHSDLKIIFLEVKKYCLIDFDISCGYRSIEDQQKAYKEGKSQLDGVNNKSKHNLIPAEAIDIYAYKPGGKASYTIHQMAYIAGAIQATAISLYIQGKISHIIRWGGNWDSDGYIIDDQDFQDLPHFELMEI